MPEQMSDTSGLVTALTVPAADVIASPQASASMARRHGMSCIAIIADGGESWSASTDVEALRSALHDGGISVAALICPVTLPARHDSSAGWAGATAADFESSIECAAAWGATTVVLELRRAASTDGSNDPAGARSRTVAAVDERASASVAQAPGTAPPAERTPGAPTQPGSGYEDALAAVHDRLASITRLAEQSGVHVAVECPGPGVLWSPVEVRNLVDEINSPCVGAGLHADRCTVLGDPIDWMHTLRSRLRCVRVTGASQAVVALGPGMADTFTRLGCRGPVLLEMPALRRGINPLPFGRSC